VPSKVSGILMFLSQNCHFKGSFVLVFGCGIVPSTGTSHVGIVPTTGTINSNKNRQIGGFF